MARPFKITRLTKSGGQFASGKYAVAICHRSGFKYPYKDMVFEPGTNYFVHKSEDDGEWSLVTHPQNYPPEKLTERIALRWAHRDTELSVGAIVCLADLFTQTGNYVTSAGAVFVSGNPQVSVATGVSTSIGAQASLGLNFSTATNSQYYILVFPGI